MEGNFATDELVGDQGWGEGCLVSGGGTLPERSWGEERKRRRRRWIEERRPNRGESESEAGESVTMGLGCRGFGADHK